jgi:AcrR family transcriptional regulator
MACASEQKLSGATRQRIVNAAESLFIEHGFEASSLRLVTAKAKVNLAAVNYHFGGKDELFRAMLARRLDLLNEQRIALLDRYQQTGEPLSCETILSAMLIPALGIARDAKRGGKDFLRLLGRAYVDPSPVLRHFLSERYAPMIARFKEAFGRALPQLSRQELTWRLHFMMGALAYTLAGADAWKLIAALNPESGNDALLLRRLAPFLIAGLKAPLPDLNEHDLLIPGPLTRSAGKIDILRNAARKAA